MFELGQKSGPPFAFEPFRIEGISRGDVYGPSEGGGRGTYPFLSTMQEEEDAMDYVTRLAAGMHLVIPHHVLCSDHVMEKWDPELVGVNDRCLKHWF